MCNASASGNSRCNRNLSQRTLSFTVKFSSSTFSEGSFFHSVFSVRPETSVAMITHYEHSALLLSCTLHNDVARKQIPVTLSPVVADIPWSAATKDEACLTPKAVFKQPRPASKILFVLFKRERDHSFFISLVLVDLHTWCPSLPKTVLLNSAAPCGPCQCQSLHGRRLSLPSHRQPA